MKSPSREHVPPEVVDSKRASDKDLSKKIADLRPYLLNYLCKLTKNKTEAEDLTQQAIAQALHGISSFRDGTYLKTWLTQIARNIFLSKLKRDAVASRADVESAAMSAHREPEGDVLARKVLDEAIQELSEDTQELLRLVVDGMLHEDIAKQLGIPVGTVRSRLNRIRATLDATLRAKGYELPWK